MNNKEKILLHLFKACNLIGHVGKKLTDNPGPEDVLIANAELDEAIKQLTVAKKDLLPDADPDSATSGSQEGTPPPVTDD